MTAAIVVPLPRFVFRAGRNYFIAFEPAVKLNGPQGPRGLKRLPGPSGAEGTETAVPFRSFHNSRDFILEIRSTTPNARSPPILREIQFH
jgi:hypothetical protein